jgi:uncharacterized protein YndB with AHSA1/START domain
MTVESAGMVSVTRRIESPCERIFDAWLDPAQAAKFLFATPAGTIVRVEIDARVGGAFNLTDRRAGEDVEHVGTYLEIDRPRRLVFTFAVPKYSSLFTRVSLEFEPLPSGCELTLTHEGILPEYIEPTRAGWGRIIDGLSANVGQAF